MYKAFATKLVLCYRLLCYRFPNSVITDDHHCMPSQDHARDTIRDFRTAVSAVFYSTEYFLKHRYQRCCVTAYDTPPLHSSRPFTEIARHNYNLTSRRSSTEEIHVVHQLTLSQGLKDAGRKGE